VFRFVGGKLSKQDNAVTMQTPSATIGIRGGLILVDLTPDGQLQVIFGYGAGVTVTGLNGLAQTITRPGFQVTVAGRGAAPSTPSPTPPGAAAALLAQLDGRPGGNGGARTIPTDATVANSGIAAAVSSTVGSQAQTQQPPRVAKAVQQATTTVQVAANSPVVQASITASQAQTTPTAPPGTTSPPGMLPVTPPPVVITYAGLFKDTPGNGTATTQGFINQGPNNRIPYTGGTLTYPAGQPANGVFAATLAAGSIQFPLAPGSTSPGFVNFGPAGTASPFGQFTGTSYMAPDSTFFYANLTPTNPALQQERGFIFGGQPVNQSFYAPTANNRFFAFNLQPDAALNSPIPFVTNSSGGNVANPSVSPIYAVAPPNTQFGAFNANTNPNVNSPHYLQASLGISGQGASQSSVLVVSTGSFFTSTASGTVVANGPVRGTYLPGGTSVPVRTTAGAATVPDGLGNNLFGGNTINGFVLDQNTYSTTDNPVQQVADSAPLGRATTTYAFNQPAVATSVPSTITGVSRTTQTLSGSFGGIMYPNTVATGQLGSPYPVTGNATVSTNATNNRVAVTLTGSDPLTSATSGINSLVVKFGSVTGNGFARSAFINDNVFAAAEDPVTPSQINGTSLPTFSSGSNLYSRAALVSSGTVSNPLLPNGLCQQCQFLQWGYWTAVLDTPNAAGTAALRLDAAHINTWVAGVPSITLPAAGVGIFSGNAIGSVVNGGASYLASGGFTNRYDFGNHTGMFAISNFDGKTVSGTVNGIGAGYSGALSGSGLTGSANGSFFGNLPGNPATETGGNFALRGPAYLASGIFAGHR
jgi:hypothetical protein